MRTAYKVLLVVVFPMLVLAGYQFITVSNTFDLIEDVRANLFVSSAREVKYAGDVLFMTGIINSVLFEIDTAAELGDTDRLANAVQRYREIQLQRYYSLQKLKEAVDADASSQFEFIQSLDESRFEDVYEIERKIKEIDALNEEIIAKASMNHTTGEEFDDQFLQITKGNDLTRELAEDLAVFTNDRYIKIETTSKLVAETEGRAENTLNMILLMGYLLAGIMVLFIYSLIIRPIERFAHALELGSMEKVEWRAFESVRTDEIGQIYQGLNKWLGMPSRKETPVSARPILKKKKKKSRTKHDQ